MKRKLTQSMPWLLTALLLSAVLAPNAPAAPVSEQEAVAAADFWFRAEVTAAHTKLAEAGKIAAVKQMAARPFPTVVEASGSVTGVQAALDVVAPEGKVLVIGDYKTGRASFAWNELLHRQIELIGSNASAGAWPDAVRLVAGGILPLDRLVTHRFPASHVRVFPSTGHMRLAACPTVYEQLIEWWDLPDRD